MGAAQCGTVEPESPSQERSPNPVENSPNPAVDNRSNQAVVKQGAHASPAKLEIDRIKDHYDTVSQKHHIWLSYRRITRMAGSSKPLRDCKFEIIETTPTKVQELILENPLLPQLKQRLGYDIYEFEVAPEFKGFARVQCTGIHSRLQYVDIQNKLAYHNFQDIPQSIAIPPALYLLR